MAVHHLELLVAAKNLELHIHVLTDWLTYRLCITLSIIYNTSCVLGGSKKTLGPNIISSQAIPILYALQIQKT